MKQKIDLWSSLLQKKCLHNYLEKAKSRYPKWGQGARYYDILENFVNGMHYGFLDSRASAIAFQFFIAIFPLILALATLVPYLPFDEKVIMNSVFSIFSVEISEYLMTTVESFFTEQRIGLMSISFLVLFIFVSKGISTMMKSLNNSYQPVLDRPWWVVRIISLLFAVVLFVFLVIIIILITSQDIFIHKFIGYDSGIWSVLMIRFFQLFKLVLLIFFAITAISFIYYYSPGGERKTFKLWSPGAFVAVFIIGIATFLFKIYIVNFSNYNYFYGSLAAMIIFMILLKTYSIALIIGFEINAAIGLAKRKKFLEDNKMRKMITKNTEVTSQGRNSRQLQRRV
ncbi:MAG: YihY/virulence factor BrkB family protein [Bacteroidales bacterium]|jgi:membrane protein|nr:YihY/virulence factor BrkB family protein [Bacteroidales bacterium]MDD2203837.1 YihY/virulence factor BrkB family protein [Bacteroidales bacterium]MDD3152811.1 YihY/virulence factor BrkB family protein [Bacteroidales bacterium]MDD3913147.1 YihY/virulence factor BrkB family protein [Bacteroidales bacterium]MDD4633062.1 YihY/virulence factor BrkB family protein [Bacteroidales bacterium]